MRLEEAHFSNDVTKPYFIMDHLFFHKPFFIYRLHRLEELAIRWLGPMSLALYLTDREATMLIEYITNSRILQHRTNIGYHIVYVDGVSLITDIGLLFDP